MLDILPNSITGLAGYGPYALALLGMWGAFGFGRRVREKTAAKKKAEAASQPPSLHPLIDPALCIGCGACTHACPEGKIIGLIGGKAELLDPASCIGHGACKTACPVGAIDLVFGTAKRGVDLPQVAPDFQSNVPGLYIAGELGGMGRSPTPSNRAARPSTRSTSSTACANRACSMSSSSAVGRPALPQASRLWKSA